MERADAEHNRAQRYIELSTGSKTTSDKNPYTDAAIEARNIVRDLEGLRLRAGVDELLALLGQIAKSGGLQEIERAKIRMSQPAQTTEERHETKRSPISDVGEKLGRENF